MRDLITVWVGRDAAATKFYINADLAMQHSELFSATLTKGSKAVEEQTVRLPDLSENEAAVFESFQSFLSTGKVVSGQYEGNHEEDEEWDRLADSWLLGNSLLSGSFKDAVVDALVYKSTLEQSIPGDIYTDLYENSSDSSPIRKLMVDIAVHAWDEEEDFEKVDTDHNSAVHARFLRDVAVALFRVKHLSEAQQPKNPLILESGCLYHEHGADKPCYNTMFE